MELIRTINKLGHGISYDVTQSLLTEVAYQKVDKADKENIPLPESTQEGTLPMLTEDNIDRLEETLSGKKLVFFVKFMNLYIQHFSQQSEFVKSLSFVEIFNYVFSQEKARRTRLTR